MKKGLLLLTITTALGTLAGCSIFKEISGLTYKSLEDYFQKENYTGSENVSSFNSLMQEHIYFWERKEQTYTNTSRKDIRYISPRSDEILFYQDISQISVRSKYSENIKIFPSESDMIMLSYSFEEEDKIYVLRDLTMQYVKNGTTTLLDMDDAHKDILKLHEYSGGYLFATQKNFMMYVKKDFSNVYLNIDNTKKFTTYEESITLPDSDLLTETLAKAKTSIKFELPVPKGYDQKIYSKDDYDDEGWSNYDVILPYLKPTEYLEAVKAAGLEVYRGDNYGIYDIDREQGGEWIIYDKEHEFKTHLSYQTAIAVVFGKDTHGIRLRVQKADKTFSSFGCSVTTTTDWEESDKQTMKACFNYVLPFKQFGRSFHIDSTKRKNNEHPLISPLDMDVECYFICDNFYKDVIIAEDYGALLVRDGFTKYVPPVDFNSKTEDIAAWRQTPEIKYIGCYLSDERDLAIKLVFDDIYGNLIKVFKKSEMLSWQEGQDQ